MTPAQFVARIKRREIGPAYLFLGDEDYERKRCRDVLITTLLTPEEREAGITQYDLNDNSLAQVLDDARSLSLFAPSRVILVANAEAALPRGKAEEDSDGDTSGEDADLLSRYLKDPSPGVVLLFDVRRFELEGEDKKRLERVRKFYSAIADAVELRRFSMDDARAEAHELAKNSRVEIEPEALDLLVEALGADVARIAVEIEKLSLFAAEGRRISVDDISALVPDARSTTVFALVGALGRRDRSRGLELLDTLCREGEYLPLALAFLSTQFRLALASKEAGLRSPHQIQGHFARSGVPMWGSRADQVFQTVSKFSKEQLERALQSIFEADRDLRSAHPDDRTVMERFVLKLTA
jgi:DNA polymerase-3 subunit delta